MKRQTKRLAVCLEDDGNESWFFARRAADTRDVVRVSLSFVFARLLLAASFESEAAWRGHLERTIVSATDHPGSRSHA